MSLCSSLRRALSRLILSPPLPRMKAANVNAHAFPLLRFSTTFSENALIPGSLVRPFSTTTLRPDVAGSKKSGSAVKRSRQSEERRLRNKSRKTLIKTRMKKVFKALDELKVSSSPSREDFEPINKLISEAQSAIDKAVKVGTLHKNTGARRKARLIRRRKAVQIHLGLNKQARAV
uniref:30S ribosomal protein S20, chloroplastic n=1 Tax=Araucaria cunninghamii TaxID=56994 RepID=A0A0D6QRM8_ARACU